MNRYYFFIFGIILLALSSINNASAAIEEIGPIAPRDCVLLIQTCGNCTFNNITSVIMSDGITIAQGPVGMTKAGTQYTFNFCNTTAVGTYRVNGFGDLDGNIQQWNYNLLVEEGDLVIFLALSVLGLLLLIIAIWSENEWLGFISGVCFMLAGLYSMIYGLNNIADLYTRGLAFVFIGLGLLFEIVAGYKIVDSTFGFKMRQEAE